jgi:hypothetical protein
LISQSRGLGDVYKRQGLIMTVGQIIVFAMICFAFWLGNRSGYANGYVAGRKAVRKHYEKLEQQFKVSR